MGRAAINITQSRRSDTVGHGFDELFFVVPFPEGEGSSCMNAITNVILSHLAAFILCHGKKSKDRNESLAWDCHSRTYIHPRMR
jgi:hypothetical protein